MEESVNDKHSSLFTKKQKVWPKKSFGSVLLFCPKNVKERFRKMRNELKIAEVKPLPGLSVTWFLLWGGGDW